MKIQQLIAWILVLILLPAAFPGAAQVQYITDIRVSVQPADGSETEMPVQATPAPVPSPSPTPETVPEETPLTGSGEYEIDVDLANQIVTVYRAGERGQAAIMRQMICSSGKNGSTPLGDFIMPEVQKVDEREAWYYIGKFRLHVQYASRIVRDILFHSLPSVKNGASPTQDSREALGTPASHGCIRLRPADSRWIAENCPPGTLVHIHDDAEKDEVLHDLLMKTSFSSDQMGYIELLTGRVLLSISSSVPQVLQLQNKLTELGYDCGEIDGVFGAGTHAAVLAWQEDNGLAATGEMNEFQLGLLLNTPADHPAAQAEAEENTPQAEPDEGGKARVRVDSSLKLRSQPSAKSKVLDKLANGTEVEVLGTEGSWYKIRVNGSTGYVGRDFIQFID